MSDRKLNRKQLAKYIKNTACPCCGDLYSPECDTELDFESGVEDARHWSCPTCGAKWLVYYDITRVEITEESYEDNI